MADNTTLAGLLSGSNSPLASQILNAQQDQSQLDLAQNNAAWGNQQGPLQALARAISAVNGRTGLNADLANIQAQKANAQSDLAQMYASGMDYPSYIAAHPEMSDLAKAMVLNQSPETTAQTNLVSQQANILRQRASMLKNIPRAQAAWNAGGPNANVSVAPAPISGVGGVAPAVSSTTADATMLPQQRALLDSIAGPESGGAYNVRYDGSPAFATFDDMSKHPNVAAPITSGPYAGSTSTAAGRYQMLDKTFEPVAQSLGLTDFSPVSQDQAAWQLAADTYKGKTGNDLLGDLKAGKTQDVAAALGGQWPTIGKAMGSYNSNLAKYTQAGSAVGGGTTGTDNTLPAVPDFAGRLAGNESAPYAPAAAAAAPIQLAQADTGTATDAAPDTASEAAWRQLNPAALTGKAAQPTPGPGAGVVGAGYDNPMTAAGKALAAARPPVSPGIAALAGVGGPRLGPQQQVPQPPVQPTNIAAPTPGVAALAAAGNPAAPAPSPASAAGAAPQGAPNAAPVATATPAAKIDPAEVARWQDWATKGFNLASQYDQAGLTANAENVRAQIANNPEYQAFKTRMAKQAEADVALANAGPLAEATDLGKIHDYRTGGAGFKYNPATGRMDIVAQNPQLPVGTSLTMGPNGQPIAAEVPGAMGAIQAAAQAHNAVPKLEKVVDPATGQESYQYMTPPMAGGASTSAPSAPVSPAGGAAGTIPLGAPSPTGNAAAPPGSVAALGPGQHEALVTRANEEQKQRQEVIDQAGAAQQMQAGLQNMQNDMGNFTQGPLAEHTQTALKYLRLIVPSFNGPVASYEDFIKNAGSLTRAAVHETSPRASQQEYAMINNTLPNPEMSPQGLQMVTNELMGLSDYKIAKAQAQQQFEQAHGGIGNVSGFETDFQKNVTPYAFIIGRMAPPDRLQMISKLQASPEGKIELGKIGQQMQYIKSTGLDQALQ